METFGQRLRQLRMKKGLTQSQLAEGIITPSMYTQIESDKARPSWHVLEQTAQKLELSVDELIGNSQMNLVLVSEYRLAVGMLSTNEFSGALPLLEKVINSNNGSLDPFEIRYDYACCLLGLHQFRDAEDAFQQLLEHANSSNGSPILAARVLHQLGHVELKRKRYQIAEHYVSLALAKLQSSGSKYVHLHCSLLMTLGDVQKQSGQMRKAVGTLQSAVPIFEEREDTEGLENLYMKLAQSSLWADDSVRD